MENNTQTNQERQKSHISSDISFTPDKKTNETPMTDHSLNAEKSSNQQKQTGYQALRFAHLMILALSMLI